MWTPQARNFGWCSETCEHRGQFKISWVNNEHHCSLLEHLPFGCPLSTVSAKRDFLGPRGTLVLYTLGWSVRPPIHPRISSPSSRPPFFCFFSFFSSFSFSLSSKSRTIRSCWRKKQFKVDLARGDGATPLFKACHKVWSTFQNLLHHILSFVRQC